MKQNIANSNRLFVDRPLDNKAAEFGPTPSLWTLSKSNTDFTDAALRVFLLLCLIASLVLGGLKISGVPMNQESESSRLSLRVRMSNPLPNASFGITLR